MALLFSPKFLAERTSSVLVRKRYRVDHKQQSHNEQYCKSHGDTSLSC